MIFPGISLLFRFFSLKKAKKTTPKRLSQVVITVNPMKQTFYGFCLPQFYTDRINKNSSYDPFEGSASGPRNTPVTPLCRRHAIEAQHVPFCSSVLIFYTILLLQIISKKQPHASTQRSHGSTPSRRVGMRILNRPGIPAASG